MLLLPEFMTQIVMQMRCARCMSEHHIQDVCAIGLRKKGGALFPTVELECRYCGEVAMLLLSTTPRTVQYFGEELAAIPYDDGAPPEEAPPEHTLTRAVPKGPRLRLVGDERRSGRWDGLALFGGYRSALSGASVLLCRRWVFWRQPYDGLVKVAARAKVWVDEPRGDESILRTDWDKFLALPPRAAFRLEGVMWRKMTIAELRKVADQGRYRLRRPELWCEQS